MHVMSHRELYCPAHFGNSYEVMWPNEMRDLLSEAKVWGFTHYSDWFDNQDLRSPASLGLHDDYSTGPLYRQRKISHYQSASELGFGLNMVLTPNHVYMDQVSSDVAAERSESKIFGQLVCPSIPRGREIILDNHRDLFRELFEAGVRLTSISPGPYDFGGCTCERCSPWIISFGKLIVDIHTIGREFYPDLELRLFGWWWTAEEHLLFSDWANTEHPGLFRSLASYIPYDSVAPDASLKYPEACERHAFVHIGYADTTDLHDLYGGWGPTIAPNRIEETLSSIAKQGVTGFIAYSEGVYDDVNKALIAGMSSGTYGSAADVLSAYAERYFGATGSDRAAWADWLAQWGDGFRTDIAQMRREYDRLAAGAARSWRLEQVESKLRLFELHAEVMSQTKWNTKRREAAAAFHAERERLNRRIWGLGLTRHILAPAWGANRPTWQDEWEALKGHSTHGSAVHTSPPEA